jgi:tRNA(Ile)-lysidine synthase
MKRLVEHIERNIVERKLLRDGQKVLVAVSGGVDSMVLLHVLHRLAPKHRWKLTVAHFNHQLRGRASDADERFVSETAQRLGLECVCGRGDVRALQRRKKLSVEMAGRAKRQGFYRETAHRLRIRSVALGHHADDQVELFCLRLLRGSGGEGLSGMKWCSRLPAQAKLDLVRPLLNLTKASLRAYVKGNGVRFREDRSNACTDILRNRVRHELLPLLAAKYQPSVVPVILRSMDIVEMEAAFVAESAHRWLASTRRLPFDRLHPAVQRQSLRRQLDYLVSYDFDLIERLRMAPGKMFSAERGCLVWRDERGLVHRRDSAIAKAGFNPNECVWELPARPSERQFDGVNIRAEIVNHGRGFARPPRGRMGSECFDAYSVGTFVYLRHWQPGDRFQPIGMAKPVKLQDLFTNTKIPRDRRRELIVATDILGTIFWVEGLRIGEQFKLDKTTRRVLKWQWQRLPAELPPG